MRLSYRKLKERADAVDAFPRRLPGGPRILVVTGAGISAPSGLSTFRDEDGLWENHAIEQVCHAWTWKRNYDAVHRFFDERREACRRAMPNAGHEALARIVNDLGALVATQNIDDLLERAGCPDVMHLHGRVEAMHCTQCGTTFEIEGDRGDAMRCPGCSSRKAVKPGVVFMREDAPEYVRLHAAQDQLREGDVVLVAGTSGTILELTEFLGRTAARRILVDLRPPKGIPVDLFDDVVLEDATTGLPRVEDLLRGIVVDRVAEAAPSAKGP